MYVKVVPLVGEAPEKRLGDGAVIYSTGTEPVTTGRLFLTDDPAGNYVKALGIPQDAWWLEVLDSEGPTGHYSDGNASNPCWDLRYAWWWEDNDSAAGRVAHWVVTGGRIFILGDDGKTIDRVN